jgi:hypothetical protein
MQIYQGQFNRGIRLRQHGILISIGLMHVFLFLLWTYQQRSYLETDDVSKRTILELFNPSTAVPLGVQAPSIIAPEKKSSTIIKSAQSKPVQNSVPDIGAAADFQSGKVSQNNHLTVTLDTEQHEYGIDQKSGSADVSAKLNLDTRNIAKSLNVEAPILEGTTLKKNESAYTKFAQKAQQASSPREGVRYENKFLFDGRPVSKVITPYGTYCIRHYKPGELPELTPPATPVHCGNL